MVDMPILYIDIIVIVAANSIYPTANKGNI